MLLKLRVTLPDRPGSLGCVAQVLGDAGSDIIQVTVLERVRGKAVDDFTVVWPSSAPVERILKSLSLISGVHVDGVWRGSTLLESQARDVAVIAQIVKNPSKGMEVLVDSVPRVMDTEWAITLAVGPDWALNDPQKRGPVRVIYASRKVPPVLPCMDVTPLRPRTMTVHEGIHLVSVPFQKGGLVFVAARGGASTDPGAPPFHRCEVERLTQLVGAAAVVLEGRLAEFGWVEPNGADASQASAHAGRLLEKAMIR